MSSLTVPYNKKGGIKGLKINKQKIENFLKISEQMTIEFQNKINETTL